MITMALQTEKEHVDPLSLPNPVRCSSAFSKSTRARSNTIHCYSNTVTHTIYCYWKKFVSVNTARLLKEGHVQRQARWKKAKLEDLLVTCRQDTTGVITVHRPLKQHRAGKKVAPPGIKPRTSGFSCQCSSH